MAVNPHYELHVISFFTTLAERPKSSRESHLAINPLILHSGSDQLGQPSEEAVCPLQHLRFPC